MYADATEERAGAEELYASATSASNLRVDADRRTPADMVIAAGMNPYRMGLALTRLMSEWDASARPRPMEPKRVQELAAALSIESDEMRLKVPMTAGQIAQVKVEIGDAGKLGAVKWEAAIMVPNPHKGLVRTEADGKVTYRLPLAVATKHAQDWHSHELGLLLQRMKSLPEVRTALVAWIKIEMGIDEGVHLASAVLQWWLHKTCPACNGAKFRLVAGTNRTGSKACGKCKGSGESPVPHGWQGRKVLGYINACRGEAVKQLQGKFRHHRKPGA